jgi:hypothetical protein
MGAGGKSGLLSLYQAWKKAGENGQVIALESRAEACSEIEQLGFAHHVLKVDATDPIAVYEAVNEVTEGEMADLTLNCSLYDSSARSGRDRQRCRDDDREWLCARTCGVDFAFAPGVSAAAGFVQEKVWK